LRAFPRLLAGPLPCSSLTPRQRRPQPAIRSPVGTTASRTFAPNHPWHRNFFLLTAGLAWIGIIRGFGGDIAEHLSRHQRPYPLIVHFHAAIFVSWLLLFTVQILLIRSRKLAVHRRLGMAMVWLVAVMVVIGPATALTVQHRGMHDPGADPAFLSIQFTDILAFTGLVTAGLLLRNAPSAHKRLVLLATCRRLHPVHVIGIAWVLANQLTALALYASPTWLAGAKQIIALWH
jgi:hypothetical protein